MKKAILAAAVLTLALTPGLAPAGSTEPSSISGYGEVATAQGLLIFGVVESTKKCRKARTVELFNDTGNKPVYDTDTTSTRGAYAVLLEKGDNNSHLTVRVLKSEAGATKCGKDSAGISF